VPTKQIAAVRTGGGPLSRFRIAIS